MIFWYVKYQFLTRVVNYKNVNIVSRRTSQKLNISAPVTSLYIRITAVIVNNSYSLCVKKTKSRYYGKSARCNVTVNQNTVFFIEYHVYKYDSDVQPNSVTTEDDYPLHYGFSFASRSVKPKCMQTHTTSFSRYGMMITWIAGMGTGKFLWDGDRGGTGGTEKIQGS